MTTKADAKRSLLHDLSLILASDDSLFPNDLDESGAEYARWSQARSELIAEFDRRATPSGGKT